jgi:dihydrofolate reductase
MLNRISIDGFFAGPNGEIDWFIPDPEVDKAAHQGAQADSVLMGRVTYQLFESVWPKITADPKASEEMRKTAEELNQMTKIVFSKTLKRVTWENSKLVKNDIVEEVRKLKQEKGASIIIFGSGTIVQQLTSEELIDDYFFVVTPVILGEGKSLFTGAKKLALKLTETKNFKSGNILIHYTIK